MINFLASALILFFLSVIIIAFVLDLRDKKKESEIQNNYFGNGNFYRPNKLKK